MTDYIRILIIGAATVGFVAAMLPHLRPNENQENIQSSEPASLAFSFESLARKAQTCAEHPFQPSPPLPTELKKLNYDTYRLIAFDPAADIWKNDPFALEFFHRGYLFADKVAIHLVEHGQAQMVPFNPQMFQYRGELSNLTVSGNLGFAGFRVLGRFDSEKNKREITSFLGASYFRAIAQGQVYGTSARGLALDVGLPKAEEFPLFREFWIEHPVAGNQLRIWALLDSPSVAGAYQLDMRPGHDTVFDVNARLFFRRRPDKIGLAPMTSMWMWGDGIDPPANEKRPKVHDSDGLLVHTKVDEWVWRPLTRLKYPSLSHFDYTGVRGFGLIQRDRRPSSYRDDEAKYHLRPSVWIEPKGGWSDGAIELLELPAEHEGIDNIAAWWKPNETITVGKPMDLHYSIAFTSQEPQTRLARATSFRVFRRSERPIGIEIEFEGESLSGIPADAELDFIVDAQRGNVSHKVCRKQADSRWQVSFQVKPEGESPVELTAKLIKDGQRLSETWRYLCSN